MSAHNIQAYRGLGTGERKSKWFLAVAVCCPLLTVPWSVAHAVTADADFQARCTAPGVVACQGFDRVSDFAQATDPGSGFYYATSCPIWPTTCIQQDTSVFVSGGSSARWDIYGNTGANDQGNYIQHLAQAFGPGSTFYVQHAFRIDPNWLMNWETVAGSSPKISIIHNFVGGSCALEEITTNNSGGTGLFQMYGECGGTGFYTNTDGAMPNPQGLGNWLLQQGFTAPAPFSGYDCEANPDSSGTFITGPGGGLGCFVFQPNIWYTLYYKVHVGTWGQPNSSVETWIAPYGQQLKKIVNAINWTLKQNNVGDPGFDAVTLTQFMTNKNPAASHPTAHVWYDELIISSQPIAAPGAPPPTTSPCDVNGDGVVNVADVQLEVNMALGISPCTNPSGTCTVVSVQRVVNAALGGTCVNP